MRAESGVASSMATESISPPPFLVLRKWINSLSLNLSSSMSVGRPLTLTVLPSSAICWEKQNHCCEKEPHSDCRTATQKLLCRNDEHVHQHDDDKKTKTQHLFVKAVNVSIRQPFKDPTLANGKRDIFYHLPPSIGGYQDSTSTYPKTSISAAITY